ncbi:MAG: hypothetical protein JNN20_14515 [Betaproteobacteria bacterium]|nr:hypothetical protein [Betaproteobacteria bacterium]
MKNIFASLAVVAASSLLAACAGTGTAAPETAVASAGNKFCHQDRLHKVNNQFECNWVDSAAEACRGSSPVSRIAVSAAGGEPVRASRCSSGQWLVQVAAK